MLEKFKNLSEIDKKILSVTRDEFLRKGFHKTSLDEIATNLKIGKGTIYRHFGNKNILFLSVVVHMLKENWKHIEEIKKSGEGFSNSFDKLIEKIFKFHTETSRFFSTVFTEEIWKDIFKAAKKDSKLKELIEFVIDCRAEIENIVSEVLENGKNEGVINKDLNTRVVADIILLAIGHFFFSFFMDLNKKKNPFKKNYSLEEGIKELKAFIYRGIGFNFQG